ncbi:MFS transporter [Mycobacterium montefiorense]|uniref:MFS transporter n=1 Tax=Mycobacterium montefiorense TaxID=154654 RepID=UPI0021DD41BC|nr:MFS transporter [Mycobacterium montefiorense]MCV7426782.1 MFS transporter [Mycobacterium montefiorense]GLE52267.1 permease [Mycobacterium montefiorense]
MRKELPEAPIKPAMTDAVHQTHPALPGWQVGVFATACALSVATNYYVQALTPAIATDLHEPGPTVGLLVTLAQIGFAVGVIFIVPAGDLVRRKPLVCLLLGGTAGALALAAAAPNLTALACALLLASLCSVAAQILVPLAATLASPDRQGRVVGQVMSGLLVGVLLARTIAGLVAAHGGWRLMYGVAAALVAAIAIVLVFSLPDVAPSSTLSYPKLLKSIGSLLVEHPQLRVRIAYGAVTFAGFGSLWTTVALLAADRYHYGEATIGLLALVGAAGALCAQGAGRLVDRGRLHTATGIFLVAILMGWVFAAFGAHNIIALLTALILIDIGVQGVHIANQSAIYRLDPTARSRINSAYIAFYFLGGATGSTIAAIAYGHRGWRAVVLAGIIFGIIGLLMWMLRLLTGRDRDRIPSAT